VSELFSLKLLKSDDVSSSYDGYCWGFLKRFFAYFSAYTVFHSV